MRYLTTYMRIRRGARRVRGVDEVIVGEHKIWHRRRKRQGCTARRHADGMSEETAAG